MMKSLSKTTFASVCAAAALLAGCSDSKPAAEGVDLSAQARAAAAASGYVAPTDGKDG